MPPSKDSTLPNPIGHESDYWTSTVHNDTYDAISPLKADFNGKAVFISGASKGLGRAIARSYALAGASKIALGARSDLSTVEAEVQAAAKEAKRPPPVVLKVSLDVTSRESVEDAARQVERTFGRIDIVINNAGVLGQQATTADTDPDIWWDVWTVNLRGPYYVVRSFLPLLLKSEDGEKTIVNVSSVGAHVVLPGLNAYQPSKLALVRFAEFVQKEYGEQGVTSISVHPGNVPTDIIGGPANIPDNLKHIFVETPELAADTISFLTQGRRTWLGGRYINCTWDMPQLMEKKDEIVKDDKLKVRLIW